MDGLRLRRALAPDAYDMAGRLHTCPDRLLRSVAVDGAGPPARP